MAHNYIYCQPFLYASSAKANPAAIMKLDADVINKNKRIGSFLAANAKKWDKKEEWKLDLPRLKTEATMSYFSNGGNDLAEL